MSFPLMANPNKHYYTTRRSPILGIVLHVTAGAQDTDMIGEDGSAASTIRYGQTVTRAASWHGIVDSDDVVDCLPDSCTAFHVKGYNSPTLGLEICNLDAVWANKPTDWTKATIANAAAWCVPKVTVYGLPLRLASKAEVDADIKAGRPFGFTYHAWLDPARRRDPGQDFPTTLLFAYLAGQAPPPGPAAPVPAGTHPPFPLPRGWYFGPRNGPRSSVSGYYGHREDLRTWQARIRQRGWRITADGLYGPTTATTARAFQRDKRMVADAKIGKATWDAAFTAPVT